MKVYVKRNMFKYNEEVYTKDILQYIEDECSCFKNVDYKICTTETLDSFNFQNAEMNIYLISRHMETEYDYDWDENPITNNYEELSYLSISYCPICGKKLEIIIDQVIDKTLEIEPLMKELNKLNKKRESKKKFFTRLEIIHQIKNLMNQ